jgi:hypothetical protein
MALLCASLLGGCVTALPSAQTSPSATSSTTPDVMNNPNDHAIVTLRVVDQLIAALKTERMLETGFYEPAALTDWFGPHKLTSTSNPLKVDVQIDTLDFNGVLLEIAHVRSNEASAASFSLQRKAPAPKGIANITADELVYRLGPPDKRTDFIAEQLEGRNEVPVAPPGQLPLSPQPLRMRGETTHAHGNTDIAWQWRVGASSVVLEAEINGNGTVSHLTGQQSTVSR